jgi:EAL domain-containing protein (putative c-di-GMP-specific phosphodiesterase class I)
MGARNPLARIAPLDEFLQEMDSELVGWADPVRRLRTAIEKDEFELYCQPILALQGGERYPLAEVLVRLREEEKALVPPGEFLPVFEHFRMMPQLDRWVVRHVVERLALGSRIPRFTVNVHGQTLEDAEFPHFVASQLSSNRVAAERLLFEIDESDALQRLGAASQFAAAYRAVGGAVLVDGFGRRAVSFLPIKELGVQFVKVDGAITRKVLTSDVASTKMNAVLRVSEALKFSIVAECVEEQDVLTRLKALGCGYAQGFGIYQPHPIASLA